MMTRRSTILRLKAVLKDSSLGSCKLTMLGNDFTLWSYIIKGVCDVGDLVWILARLNSKVKRRQLGSISSICSTQAAETIFLYINQIPIRFDIKQAIFKYQKTHPSPEWPATAFTAWQVAQGLWRCYSGRVVWSCGLSIFFLGFVGEGEWVGCDKVPAGLRSK